jgi:hypothetical protein
VTGTPDPYRPPAPVSFPEPPRPPHYQPRRAADELRDVDPLTDSAAHRIGLGTMIRIHQSDRGHTDVGLLTLRNLNTGADIVHWRDLLDSLALHHDLESRAPRRRFIAGWSITHAEVLDDPDGGHRRTTT